MVVQTDLNMEEEHPLKGDLSEIVRRELLKQQQQQLASSAHSIATTEYIRHCIRNRKTYIFLALILIGLGATAVGLQAKSLEKKEGEEVQESHSKRDFVRESIETVMDLLSTVDSKTAKKIFKTLVMKGTKERKPANKTQLSDDDV